MNTDTLFAKLSPILKDKELENKLEVVEYSGRSIAVFGNSIAFKDVFKNMGGRFNNKLRRRTDGVANDDDDDEQTVVGWLFPLEKKNYIEKFIKEVNADTGFISAYEVKHIVDELFRNYTEELINKTSAKTQMQDYNAFVAQQLEELKRTHPNMSYPNLMEIIAKKWDEK